MMVIGTESICQSDPQSFPENSIPVKVTRSFPPIFPIFVSPYNLSVVDQTHSNMASIIESKLKSIMTTHHEVFTETPAEAKLHFTLQIDRVTQPILHAKPQSDFFYDASNDGVIEGTLDSPEDGGTLRTDSKIQAEFRQHNPPGLSDSELQKYKSDWLVDDFVRQVSSALYGYTETFEVALPGGRLGPSSQLGALGKWREMLTALRALGELPDKKGEALRLYSIGVAREALAYDLTNEWSSRTEVEFAENDYWVATRLLPLNPPIIGAYFRAMAAADRVIGPSASAGLNFGKHETGHLSSVDLMQLSIDKASTAEIALILESEKQAERAASSAPKINSWGIARSGRSPNGRTTTTKNTASAPSFPWPPLTSSSRSTFPMALTYGSGKASNLAEVDLTLLNALKSKGYLDFSHYDVPGGFALATHMEQVDSTGAPLPLPDRWNLGNVQFRQMSLGEWARNLFLAPAGYYRVIVFVVSDQSFVSQGLAPKSEEAKYWLVGGGAQLSTSTGTVTVTPQTTCTALIYEFRRNKDRDVQFLEKDAPDAMTQLKNSGILAAFHP